MAGTNYDVIVVGAGNAGLSAALAARQQGTRVLLLDKCPKASRGGNTRFSGGGFRFTYNGIDDMRPMLPDLTDEEAAKLEVGSYTNCGFFRRCHAGDRICGGQEADEYSRGPVLRNRALAHGHEREMDSFHQHPRRESGRQDQFPSGRVISINDGGLGLVEMLFATAEKKGIEIIYEAKATGF